MHVLIHLALSADGAARAYIAALDAERDLLVLAQHGLGIRPECARVLRVLTMLLKKAASRGLTPFHIGSIMCRCLILPGHHTWSMVKNHPALSEATQEIPSHVVEPGSSIGCCRWPRQKLMSTRQGGGGSGVLAEKVHSAAGGYRQPLAWGSAALPRCLQWQVVAV